MAQEITVAPSPMPLMTLSREQRKQRGLQVLASGNPSPSEAFKAAKMLVGNFPNAKPHDIDGYLKAIAVTLAQFPSELAWECADPRTGIARSFRYQCPNIADVLDWCTEKLRQHQIWANSKPQVPALPPPPASPAMAEKVLGFLRSIADRMRIAPDPLADANKVYNERLSARREAVLAPRKSEAAE